jgi:tRNA (adenine57-N1/adenine58-N1)-methyltransferase
VIDEELEIHDDDSTQDAAPATIDAASASPWFRPRSAALQQGDLVLLYTVDHKRYLVRLQPNQRLHTHLGIFEHAAIIGTAYGSTVRSTLDHPALLLEPSLADLMRTVKRGSQVIYPKDAAYLVYRLNLRSGSRVVEAGTGSGALTIALAWAVAPAGRVYTYEVRPEAAEIARRNLIRAGLDSYVDFYTTSVDSGFQQSDADALFLDVREPWHLLEHVRRTLRPSGFFASLVPTTNQVSALVDGLEEHYFVDIQVEELLLRAYKPVPERLRPDDTMVGHTGFLVSARSLPPEADGKRWTTRERLRFRGRQRAREQAAEDEANAGNRPKYPRLPLPG